MPRKATTNKGGRPKKIVSESEENVIKMSASELKIKYIDLTREYMRIKNQRFCYMCGKSMNKSEFYTSTDPRIKTGSTAICKQCAYDIAMRVDVNGEPHEPNKESIKLALRYLDKPYIESIYNASVNEFNNVDKGNIKNNVWGAYIKNISMPQYNGMTYADSDMFKVSVVYDDEVTVEGMISDHENQDTYSDYMKNKDDVIRLLSYDPFDKENISDQPFLYSQLLGLLDSSEDSNDDMMRTASAISIVRGFLQQAKIDDTIARLMSDIGQLQNNSATIKSLQESKSKITGMIKDLAAESCISLKNSKHTKKGENTWTGKLRKIKDLNLRDGEVNGFDLMTCRGMQQVMDLSNASIIKQLRLDESEYSDMIAEQREIITKLQSDLDSYREISRILLRENIDLKDYLKEHNILDYGNMVDLTDLYSKFGDSENQQKIINEVVGDSNE